MKPSLPDPKQTLEALLSGGPLPVDVPLAQLEAARRWAAAGKGPADEVAALPAPIALALLEAAVRTKDTGLPEALAALGNRELAKAAKKALYQLRSAGVAVAAPEASRGALPKPTAEPEEYPALLSAITGNGERGMLVVRPVRGSGLESFQVVFTDEAGIIQLEPGEVSRGQFRRQLKALRESVPPVLEVDRARAQRLLAHAAALNLQSRTPYPPGTDAALRRLDVSARLSPAEIPQPTAEDEALAAQGHRLHDEPELAPWLPPEEQLHALSELMANAESSPLQLTEAQKREQVLQKIEAATQAFFTPPVRALYAGRLWEMAELFERSSRASAAASARAEAKRLFHTAHGSRFASFLMEKVVLLSARARAGQPLPEPGERLSEASAPSEKRSPGGLILP